MSNNKEPDKECNRTSNSLQLSGNINDVFKNSCNQIKNSIILMYLY
jgi:hypothetical protein